MKYIHLFKTNSEFTTAYNGPDYIAPWLSLTEETRTINSSKILTAITFGSITWVTDIPATGGTATKDNCTFKVYANYNNGSSSDISSIVTVTGELAVEPSTSDQRHEAGQLTLTASYGGFTTTGNVTVYQEAAPDFSTKPLTFNITSDGTINWTADDSSIAKTIDYKLNDGEWTSIASNTGSSAPSITVTKGDKVQFRGNNTQYATYDSWDYNSFSDSTASFEIEGNIMSLIYGDDFKNKLTISSTYAFASLFRDCTKLVSAENLILPATTLADYCYSSMFDGCTKLTTAPALSATTLKKYCYFNMFNGCTSLTTAPVLPATKLADNCYLQMFQNCTSLTTAPELPATTLAEACYQSMFNGCTSLTTAPALPATKLADYCYNSMFYGCTSLTTAPALPATILERYCYTNMFNGCTSLTIAPSVLPATYLEINCCKSMFEGCTSLTTAPELPATSSKGNCYDSMFEGCTSLTTAPKELPATILESSCYQRMFYGCTSLTKAPELPATTLASYCYNKMFNGCTSLNYIKCLARNVSASNCTGNWVSGVASTGTFVKASSMTSWTTDVNGIPANWAVQNA